MERFNPDLTLTTSEVADLLGVHPSTVKRWCNDGELVSAKTDGGHRRIHLEDAQAFARERDIETVLTPFQPYEPHVWSALRAIEDDGSFRRFQTLAMGWVHRAQLQRLSDLLEAVAHHPPVSLARFCDEAVRGLMTEVGRAWHDGRLRAGEEHMVTQVLIDVLLKLRREGYAETQPPAGGERPAAVVGSIEGNQHHLGALCIRLLLESRGWEVFFLGPDVPVEDFGMIQRGRKASLVCISLTPPATQGEANRAIRVLSEFYDPSAPYTLALGGNLDPEVAQGLGSGAPFPSVLSFDSCQEFEEALTGMPLDRVSGAQAPTEEVAS